MTKELKTELLENINLINNIIYDTNNLPEFMDQLNDVNDILYNYTMDILEIISKLICINYLSYNEISDIDDEFRDAVSELIHYGYRIQGDDRKPDRILMAKVSQLTIFIRERINIIQSAAIYYELYEAATNLKKFRELNNEK